MRGFYWLIEGALAGCGRPGGRAGGRLGAGADDDARRTPGAPGAADPVGDDLAWLREQGIRAVLTLTETPLPQDALARAGIEALHVPVPDLTAPTPAQLDEALRYIDAARGRGLPVAVHCLMGQGRTGTVLAAYTIRAGMTPDAAIADLRAICPGAIGSPEQVSALRAFARRRDWIV